MDALQNMGVSVIVPICNVEKFLDQCLESIEAQTYGNLEIILINDGSTDNSLEIMKKHEEHDPRIRIIDKKNEGYGATCNRGIKESHGKWISIIEPDDWIDKNMYMEMVDFARTFDEDIDIVKCPWTDVLDWNDPSTERMRKCPIINRMKTSTEPFELKEHPFLIETHPSIWSAIYSRKFIIDNDIKFVEYPGAGWADNPFLIETMTAAKNIVFLNKMFYYYRCDLKGSTKNHATEEKVALPFNRWIDMTKILERKKICDREILQAHYLRGFNYIYGAINDDHWDNEVVRKKTHEVFEMMDKDIVLHNPKLNTRKKQFYLDEMYPGETVQADSARIMYMLKMGVYQLKNFGIMPFVWYAYRKIKPIH